MKYLMSVGLGRDKGQGEATAARPGQLGVDVVGGANLHHLATQY